MLEKLKAHLVDDWRQFSQWWSIRMMAVGGLISGLLAAMPAMPPEVQAAIPVQYRVAAIAIWSVASIVTRLMKQRPAGG